MCSYYKCPHCEIALLCAEMKIVEHPKNSSGTEWVETIFNYKCPKCNNIWKKRYCRVLPERK